MWLVALTALGYALAYLRDAGVAALFGASQATDAFFVGTFPAMALYMVIIAGSFVPALIPVLAQAGPGDEEARAGVLCATCRWLVSGLVLVVVAGELVADRLVALLAPGFEGATLQQATLFCRLSLPMLVLLAPSGVAAATLNSRGNFIVPGLGSVAFAGAALASLSLAAGRGLWIVALSMVAGAFIQLAIYLAALKPHERRAVLLLSPGDPIAAKRVLASAGPLLAYVGMTQALPTLERLLASRLPDGTLSQVAYATKLYTLPVNVIASSFAAVLLPSLAFHAARGDGDSLNFQLRRGLARMLALMTLIVACILALAPAIVALAFERGRFGAHDTEVTAQLLSVYAVALLPLSANLVLTRGYFALERGLPPVFVASVAVAVYIAIGPLLMGAWGARGLALDMVVASLVVTLGLALCWRSNFGLRDLVRSASMTGEVRNGP